MIILFLQVMSSLSCEIVSSLTNLYPTNTEVFKLDMSEIFDGYNLTYDCPKCPQGVKVKNVLEEQSIYDGTIGQVIAADNIVDNIFVTITNKTANQEINLYEYNETSQQMALNKSVPINAQLNCFNVVFMISHNLNDTVMDCYNGSTLQFLSFNQFLLFNETSIIPLRTKMISNGSLLLYAQFYENYSLLSLLSYNNLSIMNTSKTMNVYTFTDFTVANDLEVLVLNETYVLFTTNWQLNNYSTQSISIWPQKQLAVKYYMTFQSEVHNEFLFIVTNKPFENIQQYLYQYTDLNIIDESTS